MGWHAYWNINNQTATITTNKRGKQNGNFTHSRTHCFLYRSLVHILNYFKKENAQLFSTLKNKGA